MYFVTGQQINTMSEAPVKHDTQIYATTLDSIFEKLKDPLWVCGRRDLEQKFLFSTAVAKIMPVLVQNLQGEFATMASGGEGCLNPIRHLPIPSFRVQWKGGSLKTMGTFTGGSQYVGRLNAVRDTHMGFVTMSCCKRDEKAARTDGEA